LTDHDPTCGDTSVAALTLEEIRRARTLLGARIHTTPVRALDHPMLRDLIGPATSVLLKLELLQVTGSFKARAALLNVDHLTPDQHARGVTAISAGNHAIAVAYAARAAGTTAKLVMTASANRLRVETCRQYGAELVIAPTMHDGFEVVRSIEREEGRTLLHPFEGREIAIATATLGLELCEQVTDLEAVIVPIGGGGLCAGVASAVKLLSPRCRVYGVEPAGADSMFRSLAAGRPVGIPSVETIADSLGAPRAMPISFEFCRRHVDEIVRVSDDALRRGMRMLLETAKLAVEPAAAAAFAAAVGPLRRQVEGRRLALILCGSNIDAESFARLVAANDR